MTILTTHTASSARMDCTSSSDSDDAKELCSSKLKSASTAGLVWPSCDVAVTLGDRPCQALLDTDSMVSTGTYYLSHQLKLDIHPMNHLLRVEGVGGQMLQYLGYVVSRVRVLDFDQEVDARFLVVPDIGYNCDTPVVIGTSILQHIHSSESVQAPVPLRLFSRFSRWRPQPIWVLRAPGKSGIFTFHCGILWFYWTCTSM